MNELETKAARQASLIYTAISLVITFLFLGLTFVTGESYNLVARIGGMIWIFVLSMIVSMPIIIPAVKKRVVG
ncbi:hypothetical protein [Desulfitobacterium sp.]|uniref:hypothetical protein n=1 Tax=Desulfitobacterium sp. TaxID=49981 RepID=UPI002CC5CD3E|nr:hypothetical protein [Desulfitobacterium sp.]HVJ47706.1 hypothetical protein [Desulfitobacterium sp.]